MSRFRAQSQHRPGEAFRYNGAEGNNPMRKTLETVALAGLAVMYWIAYSAVYGPNPLPNRVPTHFGITGQPNAWGSPSGMFLLPAIGTAVYLILSVVALFPSTFNYPARVTPQNRPRLEALVRQLLAWIKVDMVCLFAWIQWSILEGMRQGYMNPPRLLMPIFLVVVLGTTIGYVVAMILAGRPGSSS
jgi:uncharacterized membrane protein